MTETSNTSPASDQTVGYVRLFTDGDGTLRFEDLALSVVPTNFAPRAPPLDVSSPWPATAVMVVRAAAGLTDPAHPAPARQLMVIISGSLEVTAGDETRQFAAGDLISSRTPTDQGTPPLCSRTPSS
jgi:hypothetical protein